MKTYRLTNIDLLRGIVMVLMCIDHARDYTFYHPQDPMVIAETPLHVFILRIMAHWCAPTFVLLAGISAAMVGERGSKRSLARYLLSCGADALGNYHYQLGVEFQSALSPYLSASNLGNWRGDDSSRGIYLFKAHLYSNDKHRNIGASPFGESNPMGR
ncbi:MAG: heparan-alpha-glucosaminide N-acetyltransferase domain-containing protein [Capnocytophaga sp.]|nr:heparan-alpha-glucosaminide N-acetyltransferase domain-containing protein [Capnocytophaga sp.]